MEKPGIRAILMMAAAGIIVSVIASCAFGVFRMHGTAMEPSIEDNSIILINRLAYFYREPEVGDVVAFHCNVYSEDGDGSLLVRRVAAADDEGITVRGDSQGVILDSSDQAVGKLKVHELAGKVCFR